MTSIIATLIVIFFPMAIIAVWGYFLGANQDEIALGALAIPGMYFMLVVMTVAVIHKVNPSALDDPVKSHSKNQKVTSNQECRKSI